VLNDRPPECPAFLRVVPGELERGPGDPERLAATDGRVISNVFSAALERRSARGFSSLPSSFSSPPSTFSAGIRQSWSSTSAVSR
jgi:hypothetical protein